MLRAIPPIPANWELRRHALAALAESVVAEKLAKVAVITGLLADGRGWVHAAASLSPGDAPGRPDRPALVTPDKVPRRKLGSTAGRAALLHALAHIEFNAINLALDAVARFADLPEAYYRDWLAVAVEEADHYRLLTQLLREMGYAYGDFKAHNGLWEMAIKTRANPLARMALVPRILEARGLDVTPGIQQRLSQAGETAAVAVLDVILRDEVGHVAVGNRWYHRLCAQQGRDPSQAFNDLCAQYAVAPPRPPFNEAARLRAGFTAEELRSWMIPGR